MKCTEAWNISIKYERATANTWATAKYISEHDRRLRTLKSVNITVTITFTARIIEKVVTDDVIMMGKAVSPHNKPISL